MTEEEKAKMKKLEEDLAAEKAARTAEKVASDKILAEKDAIISQKNDDIVNQRKSYKKLSEMTEAEKAAMSDKEKELQERQETFEAEQRKFRDDQEAIRVKEVGARRMRAIEKIAGKDPELKKKIEESFSKIVDHDKAQTDEEIAAIATSAFNMLGVPRPDPVRNAIQGAGTGEAGGEGVGENFSDKPEGKSLGSAMGLESAKPPVDAGKK